MSRLPTGSFFDPTYKRRLAEARRLESIAHAHAETQMPTWSAATLLGRSRVGSRGCRARWDVLEQRRTRQPTDVVA
jgi:hypothetical protein